MEVVTFSPNLIAFLSVAAVLIGIGIAWFIYCLKRNLDRRDVIIEMMGQSKDDMQQAQERMAESYESKLRKLLERSQKDMFDKTEGYERELRQERERSRKYLADRKSSEVRTGHILEKVAPLFEDFPGDIIADNVIPVFKTFDYLVITDDEIILVEVKSGNAGLSTRQKKVKKLVEEGKVSFRTFRKRGAPKDKGEKKDDGKEDKEGSGGQI